MNTKTGTEQIISVITELAKRIDAIEERLKSSVSLVALDKEHDRVMQAMSSIYNAYSGHQTWDENDKKKFQELKKRRNELRAILGVKY